LYFDEFANLLGHL